MSDGNFNRAILPRTDYTSGYRAGRMAVIRQAADILQSTLADVCPSLSLDERQQVVDTFCERIRQNK